MINFLSQQANEWENMDQIYLTLVPHPENVGDTIKELNEMKDYIWAERYSCLDNMQVGVIIDMLKFQMHGLYSRGYISQVYLVGSIVNKFERLVYQRMERN